MVPSSPFRRVRAATLAALLTAPAATAQETADPAESAQTEAAGAPYVIALGSCNSQEGDQAYWDVIAAEDPDAFLFLGANVYGDSWDPEKEKRQFSIDRVRAAYDRFADSEPFSRFRRRVPIYPMWDDHDYGLNDAGAELPFKAESKQALLDFFDFEQEPQLAGRDGLYYAIEKQYQGRQIQILMLDTRWHRSPLAETDGRIEGRLGSYVDDPDPAKTILGPRQEAWLAEQLAKPADVRIVASSIQILADGHHFERWGNLPAARGRLYSMLAGSEAEHVLLVSGDRHAGGLYRLDGVTGYPLYELTASSLNRGRDRDPLDEYGPHQLSTLYGPENYGLISLDFAHDTVALDLHDAATGRRVRGVTVPLAELR